MKYTLLLLMPLLFCAKVARSDESVTPIKTGLTAAEVNDASIGCRDCHSTTDNSTMHDNPGVLIGCTHCHGGKADVRADGLNPDIAAYNKAKLAAHIQPKHPENWPSSANPERPYTNTLHESAEFIKFVNPGDLRVSRETCGGCHADIVRAVERSLMTTSAMLWGGAAYNNGILPYKQYILGESYNRDGEPREIRDNSELTEEMKARGALEKLIPIPQWEVLPPGDIFRVFERGGLNIRTTFPEIGNPNPLEESGKPDIRQSNRGLATGNRISVPVINIHKTRLNDPHLSFMGTNENPGDFRSSGCTACHVIYANNRDPLHSGPYAKFGHEGKTQTKDPTIPREESGHPLKHAFTRSIPTSQCMVCHMHQPNMFVNTYLGYTMWDYESDAPSMWPKEQRYPTIEETFKALDRNPEEAVIRGLWSDKEFLKQVSEMNPKLEHTQFADYHGHGWNFRAVFKRDRKGRLLDKDGEIIKFDDPDKFKKSVLMSDIHLDKGMHCVDCHFQQDAHGDGHIYGEVAQQVEITCEDCHGTVKAKADLVTSGPASKTTGGNDLTLMRTQFGERRFEWRGNSLYQRSSLTPGLEWRVDQVREMIDSTSPHYNAKAARAKTTERLADDTTKAKWGDIKKIDNSPDTTKVLAHADEKVACFTCHSSWITTCAGCHLPIQANWKQKSKHYDGKTTRNWASYNPQAARDEAYQIGIHGPAKDHKIVPVRSSSALILSSTDINRQRIYIQQPPIASSGHSSQAFAPHFPHTVRKVETKQCEDCHVSAANDNNAIMAQLMLLGTNFLNFMGFNAWVGTDHGLEAIQVTEWDEPQAVIGSYLHRYAYPDYYKAHKERGLELVEAYNHHAEGGAVNTLQLRGEYLYTTAGEGGFRVYDVASVANKGFSERIVTSPVSPLGQDTHVASTDATSFVIPTNMPVDPERKQLPENLETPLHAIYRYAFVADRVEGLIVINVDTLADRDPTNNFLERALTWNEEGVLDGAKFITMAGSHLFVLTESKVVLLDVDDPLKPKVLSSLTFNDPRALAVQFRYAFVTDAEGFHVVDITHPDKPRKSASVALTSATNLYIARTYAYVAGGKKGLIIIDIERPEEPRIYETFTDGGKMTDVRDVKVATTNASLFAYVADGENGLKVLQLTDPDRVPEYYGFAPPVKPKVIAWRKTEGAALSLSKALDRDRAVDETGNQVSVFGRIGSRPFTLEEMKRLYLTASGQLFTVKNEN